MEMYVQDLNEGLTEGVSGEPGWSRRAVPRVHAVSLLVCRPLLARHLLLARRILFRASLTVAPRVPLPAPHPSWRRWHVDRHGGPAAMQESQEFDFDGQANDPVGAGWGMDDLDSVLLKGMKKKRRQCVLTAAARLVSRRAASCLAVSCGSRVRGPISASFARELTAAAATHCGTGVPRVWSGWS